MHTCQACSGKFSPIFQWMYFDALECLPETPVDPALLQPVRWRKTLIMIE